MRFQLPIFTMRLNLHLITRLEQIEGVIVNLLLLITYCYLANLRLLYRSFLTGDTKADFFAMLIKVANLKVN